MSKLVVFLKKVCLYSLLYHHLAPPESSSRETEDPLPANSGGDLPIPPFVPLSAAVQELMHPSLME